MKQKANKKTKILFMFLFLCLITSHSLVCGQDMGYWKQIDVIVDKKDNVVNSKKVNKYTLTNGTISVYFSRTKHHIGGVGFINAEGKWTLPPKILKPGKGYPFSLSISRKDWQRGQTLLGVSLSMSITNFNDSDCRSSSLVYIGYCDVYVHEGASCDSKSGEFIAPNYDDYNFDKTNKFQIKIYTEAGCVRYIYEWVAQKK